MSTTAPVLESLELLLWMLLPVAAGYLLGRRVLGQRRDGEPAAAALARRLASVGMLWLTTPLMLIVFWAAPLPSGKAALLPLVGLAVHLAGSAAGWAASIAGGSPRPLRGAFILGGGTSNVLTFGGISVLLLLAAPSDPSAERALGEMALYRLLEAPFYFLLAWPLAAIASGSAGAEWSWRSSFRQVFRPVTAVPLAGIAAGWALNAAGIPRPGPLDGAADALVKATVILLGLSVGLGLRRAAPARHLGPCLLVSAIKFLLMPAVGVGLAWALGFRGPTLQVVLVCASMPVAFMAVVGASLYGLEDELVGSLWIFTTAAMVVVVPVLAIAVPRLGWE
ncbi:MAG: AEC family transporter [Planctomycetes bacterium]|nr:AEC family transporter [Planctomycetota bacterium]